VPGLRMVDRCRGAHFARRFVYALSETTAHEAVLAVPLLHYARSMDGKDQGPLCVVCHGPRARAEWARALRRLRQAGGSALDVGCRRTGVLPLRRWPWNPQHRPAIRWDREFAMFLYWKSPGRGPCGYRVFWEAALMVFGRSHQPGLLIVGLARFWIRRMTWARNTSEAPAHPREAIALLLVGDAWHFPNHSSSARSSHRGFSVLDDAASPCMCRPIGAANPARIGLGSPVVARWYRGTLESSRVARALIAGIAGLCSSARRWRLVGVCRKDTGGGIGRIENRCGNLFLGARPGRRASVLVSVTNRLSRKCPTRGRC